MTSQKPAAALVRGRRRVLVVALVLLAAGCGGGDAEEGAGQDAEVSPAAAGGDSGQGQDDEGSGGDGGNDGNTVGDDDDAAEIVGNPDLDLEELEGVAPDAAEALDDIDDIVSIGDCESEAVGLGMSVVPDDWQCRVFDIPVNGVDGFTLFNPAQPGFEITVGTPSELGSPCEILQFCDMAEPIDLGDNTTMSVVDLGVPIIFGTHNSVDAEISVIAPTALTDADLEFVTDVLVGLVPV